MKTTDVRRTWFAGLCAWGLLGGMAMSDDSGTAVNLPPPQREGGVDLAEALDSRRSSRAFSDTPLTLAEIGQLCWAAQGRTGPDGHRTAPSAGALYPLELYVVAARVRELEAGIYRYLPAAHALRLQVSGDRMGALVPVALRQEWVGDAAAVFVITAVHERITGKYGDRGVRYADIEAGHAGQNLLLQAVGLGLSGCPVGAFDDDGIRTFLAAPPEEAPRYLLPVGRP